MRRTAEDRKSEQKKQSREVKSSASLALEAILAGGSWEQLPADGLLSLSHTMGNGALLDLFALRNTGPEIDTRALPRGECRTEPMSRGGGEPLMADAPDFGVLSPMGAAAPLEL